MEKFAKFDLDNFVIFKVIKAKFGEKVEIY